MIFDKPLGASLIKQLKINSLIKTMNFETLVAFLLFIVLPSLSSAQGWGWAPFDTQNYHHLNANTYFDWYVNLIAGRTYNIFLLGDYGFNVTLTATDSAGYEAFNDDWTTSWPHGGRDYAGSSSIDFVPTVSGLVRLRTQPAAATSGESYIYVTEKSCSPSCTSKFFESIPKKISNFSLPTYEWNLRDVS